jgi:hypothetical protein
LRKPSRTRASSSAKCNGSAATLVARLESLGGSVLAEQTFELLSTDFGTWTKLDFARAVHASAHHGADCGTWTKLDFALAPKTGTDCVGTEVGSDPGGSLHE